MRLHKKRKNLTSRQINKVKIRKKLHGTADRPRISVFRSGKHTYAQLIEDVQGMTVASASTLDKEVMESLASVNKEGVHSETKSPKGTLAAKAVGILLAKRAMEKNVKAVVFDRNGYEYKGRVKAVAEGAREGGLNF